MLSEKNRTKAFNRAINVIKSTRFGAGSPNHWFVEYLKGNRAEVLARAERHAATAEESPDGFEECVLTAMRDMLLERLSPAYVTRLQATLRALLAVRERLLALEEDLAVKRPDWSGEADGWDEAGVARCTKGVAKAGEEPRFPTLRDPRPVVWVLRQVKEATAGLPQGYDSEVIVRSALGAISYRADTPEDNVPEDVAIEALQGAASEVDDMIASAQEAVEEADYRLREDEILEQVLIGMETLKRTVVEGRATFDTARDFWGGAGVVVTSDDSNEQYENDFVVRLRNPRPLVWILGQLRVVCKPILTWENKGAFYGLAAETAKMHAERHGQEPESVLAMLLTIIDDVATELQRRHAEVKPDRQRLLESVRSLG